MREIWGVQKFHHMKPQNVPDFHRDSRRHRNHRWNVVCSMPLALFQTRFPGFWCSKSSCPSSWRKIMLHLWSLSSLSLVLSSLSLVLSSLLLFWFIVMIILINIFSSLFGRECPSTYVTWSMAFSEKSPGSKLRRGSRHRGDVSWAPWKHIYIWYIYMIYMIYTYIYTYIY